MCPCPIVHQALHTGILLYHTSFPYIFTWNLKNYRDKTLFQKIKNNLILKNLNTPVPTFQVKTISLCVYLTCTHSI